MHLLLLAISPLYLVDQTAGLGPALLVVAATVVLMRRTGPR